MRYMPLLLLLASCQTWGWSETADVLLPDEFQIGEGSSSLNTVGGYTGHSNMYEYMGEGESTYAALTWHLPQVKSENGMSRETQRNLALLVDHMAEEEGLVAADPIEAEAPEEVSAGPLKLNLREGVALPPKEVGYGLLAVLLIGVVFVRLKQRSSRRQW
jgi:hypothetical protein